MEISLNNNKVTTDADSLATLLQEQGIETKGIAVAVDRRVVPRAMWAEFQIEEGAQIVVVSAVYGG